MVIHRMRNQGAFPLPITVEEVTAPWLTAALRTRTPGITVLSAELVDANLGTCSKLRYRLVLDEAGRAAGIPELIMVKGGFEEHARQLSQMHEREVIGYRDVYPHIPLPHPACFFAEYDAEQRQGIVIMEDLAARGVEFCHATRPQTHEQIARRLSALARFHSATWGSAELESGGRWGHLPEFFPVMQSFTDRVLAPEAWAEFIAAPRGAASSRKFHDRAWIVDAVERVKRYCTTLPHAVLHGDIHLGNLYIEPDGTPGFLDTLASKGPPLLEVSYHISASIDAADRRQSEGALVQHYLDEAERAGAAVPSFAEAMRQYAIFLLYGHFIWTTTRSHFQPEAVNTANAARVSAAMLDHGTYELLAELA
jgi:hypothetical protein